MSNSKALAKGRKSWGGGKPPLSSEWEACPCLLRGERVGVEGNAILLSDEEAKEYLAKGRKSWGGGKRTLLVVNIHFLTAC